MNQRVRFALLVLLFIGFTFSSRMSRSEEAEATHPQASANASSVKISWMEFLEILKKSYAPEKAAVKPSPTPPAAPVEFLVPQAHYKIEIGKDQSTVTATFSVHIFKERGFVSVPLLPQQVAMESLRENGHLVPMHTINGYHAYLSQSPGIKTLEARFTVADSLNGDSNKIGLPIIATPATTVSVSLPLARTEVIISPASAQRTSSDQRHTLVEAEIPPSQQVSIEWVKTVPALPSVGTKEKTPEAKLYAEVLTLVSASDSYLRFDNAVNYTIVNGETRQFDLAYPKDVQVLEVNGDGIRDWSVIASSPSTEQQKIHVELDYAAKNFFTVHILAEKTLKKEQPLSQIPEMKPLNVARDTGFIGIESIANIELIPQGEKNLRRIDVSELPRPLVFKASRPVLFAYKFFQRPLALDLEVKRNEDISVQVATIDHLNVLTVLFEDGLLVHDLNYEVRNTLKQFLKLKLPKISQEKLQVLSVLVAHRPTRASLDKDGNILIPLEKSSLDASELKSFPVEIIYQEKQAAFSSLGGLKNIIINAADIPTSRVDYQIFVPNEIKILHLGGNFETSRSIPEPIVISNLSNEKDTGLGLFHAVKRKGLMPLDQAMPQTAAPQEVLVEEAERQADVGKSSLAKLDNRLRSLDENSRNQAVTPQGAAEAPFVAGIFSGPKPVIPTEGQLFSFSKMLAKGDWQPEFTLIYAGRRLAGFLALLTLCLAILTGLQISNLLKSGKRNFVPLVSLTILTIAAKVFSGVNARYVLLFVLVPLSIVFFQKYKGQILGFFEDKREHGKNYRLSLWIVAAFSVFWFGFWLFGASGRVLLAFLGCFAVAVLTLLLARFVLTKRFKKRRGVSTAVVLFLALGLINQFGFTCSAFAQSPGSVNMRWEEFEPIIRKLLVQPIPSPTATPEPIVPPKEFIVSRAYYRGEMGKENTLFSALFSIHVLTEQWAKVPILPAEVGIREARIDDKVASLHIERGNHALLVRGPRNLDLEVKFSLPKGYAKGTNRLSFNYLPTPANVLELALPSGKNEIRISPNHGFEISSLSAGSNRLKAVLPEWGPVTIEWSEKAKENLVEKKEAKIYADLYTLVNVREGSLDLTTLVDYNIIQGEADHFFLTVPNDLAIKSVEGVSKREWTVVDQNGQKILRVFLNRAVKDFYRLSINAEKVLNEATATVQISDLRTLETERDQGLIGIITESVVEVTPNAEKGLLPADIRLFSEKMGALTSRPVLFAYRFLREPFLLELNIVRNQDIALQTTAIDAIDGTSLFVEDGQALHRVFYTVRNTQKQYLKLNLPEAAEILGAFLSNGRNTEPVSLSKNSNNILQIPLLQSVGNQTSLQSFQLEIYYLTQTRRFNGFYGSVNDILPAVDVPASQVNWQVYVPGDGRYFFSGNMKEVDNVASAPLSMSEGREDHEGSRVSGTAGEPDFAGADKEGFLSSGGKSETKRELDTVYQGQIAQQTLNRYKIYNQEKTRLNQVQKGGLPVKVQFPLIGRRYLFKKPMAQENFKPEIRFYYIGRAWIPALHVLGLLLAGLTALILFRHFQKRAIAPLSLAGILLGAIIVCNWISGKWAGSITILGIGCLPIILRFVESKWKWQNIKGLATPERLRLYGGLFATLVVLTSILHFGAQFIFLLFLGAVLGLLLTALLYRTEMKALFARVK